MKESRIVAFIGVYACLILANTSDGIYVYVWTGIAVFWMCRYAYLIMKK